MWLDLVLSASLCLSLSSVSLFHSLSHSLFLPQSINVALFFLNSSVTLLFPSPFFSLLFAPMLAAVFPLPFLLTNPKDFSFSSWCVDICHYVANNCPWLYTENIPIKRKVNEDTHLQNDCRCNSRILVITNVMSHLIIHLVTVVHNHFGRTELSSDE